MSSKAKRKGKRLENIVADILRKHFNVDKKYIKRAGSSGVRTEELGDIDIIHPEIEKIFPFIVECKNQEKWKLNDLLGKGISNKSNPFKSYIKQIKEELKRTNENKIGLLVFSKNQEDIYCLIFQIDRLDLSFINKLDSYMFSKLDNEKVLICKFEDFLNNYKLNKEGDR